MASPTTTPTVTPTATVTPSALLAAPGSTAAGVDCDRQLGYVAFLNLGVVSGSDGEVQVLDLSKDPGTADARVEVIDLGHADFPSGVAVDIPDGLVFVVSGDNGHGGFMDIINEATAPPSLATAGSPIAFPTGADTGGLGQALFDQSRGRVIVSTVDDKSCATVGTCTGFTAFDIATRSFGPVVQTVFNSPEVVDSFALAPGTNTIIGPNDNTDPVEFNPIQGMDAVQNLGSATPASCTLSDANFLAMIDPDGASADPTTDLFVIGDFFASAAGVFNLNGSTFGAGADCSVTEGGTPPNSALIDVSLFSPNLDAFPLGGVAVNPMTHQGLISGVFTNDLALLSLPSSPVAQLDAATITGVNTNAPALDPLGNDTTFQAFPNFATIDACNNLGYVAAIDYLAAIDDDEVGFLVQVDLSLLQSTPAGIGTALPEGSCTGTTTTIASCGNGAGVKFYPTAIVK